MLLICTWGWMLFHKWPTAVAILKQTQTVITCRGERFIVILPKDICPNFTEAFTIFMKAL
jgi:hypothetical protein